MKQIYTYLTNLIIDYIGVQNQCEHQFWEILGLEMSNFFKIKIESLSFYLVIKS